MRAEIFYPNSYAGLGVPMDINEEVGAYIILTKHDEIGDELVVFINKNGLGFELTNHYRRTCEFYSTHDWNWFYRYALDNEIRDMLTAEDVAKLERMVKEVIK